MATSRRRPTIAPRYGLRALLLGMLLGLSLNTAAAVEGSGGDSPALLESLATQRTEIDNAGNLSEEQKTQALARLEEARKQIEEARRLENRTQDLLSRIRLAPEQISKLRKDMTVAQLRLNAEELEPWTITQLEVVLNERQLTLAEIENDLAQKDRELSGYLTLARTGGSELAELERRLAELQQSALNGGADKPGDRLAVVDQLWQNGREQALRARIGWTRLQQSNLNLLTELAQLDRDLAAERAETLTEHVTQFRDYVQQRRQAEAESAKQAAQDALSGAPAEIQALQREISTLVAEQAALVNRESEYERKNQQLIRVADEVKRDLERIRQVVELGGATAQVSKLLQQRRIFAPSPKNLTQDAIRYQEQLTEAALRQLELDELLRETRDSDQKAAELVEKSGIGDESEKRQLRESARQAWTHYRDTVLDLWKGYTRYIGKLSALEANTRQLIQTGTLYREFIDDRLLWLPSTDAGPIDQASRLLSGVRWFADPDHLARLGRDSWTTVKQFSALTALWLLGFIVLLNLGRRAREGLSSAASCTQKVRTDSFKVTLTAVRDTLVLILPLPWLFIGAGLLLGRLPAASEYSLVVAAGLQSAGHALFFLRTLRQLCRPHGLANAHLCWEPVLCEHLGRQASWLTPLAAPLGFFSAAGAAAVPSPFVMLSAVVQTEEPGVVALGRVAIIALLVLLAIAVFRVWRKNGAVMKAMGSSPDRAKWASYHILWFGPAMLLPLGLALAAFTGYYYTTAFLTAKAGQTLWFILTLVFLKDLLLRWLRVAQRRLRFEEALRYREEASAQRAAAGDQPAGTEPDGLPLDEDKINYGQLGDQVRQLVGLGYTVGILVGLWLIWKDVVPAFSFLDQVELPFTTSKLVDGVSTVIPLTLSDVVAGLLLGGLALFAARNIPALLELTILQRLPLSRASRYAFTTLTQYVVAMAGVFITFNALGLQWSSIQWLVAALSVGLGFGLQEIVANFISGIILLFEQPIRVGDVVTVDNTSGTVSRIRIRATTIVNWERQELIIPNKTFITGQLINWTLSDTVNRVFITVGVSYNTDTTQAMALMYEAASEHPMVLADPAPRVTFEGFGDNALTLNLRAYLNEIDARLPTITELHSAILRKFRAAGIEIAFPQRDLHLNTSRPLELVLRRDAQASDSGS